MINKAILVGRLTRDPEVRQTQSGLSVVSFTVACDRPYSSNNGERQADFINCVAWRQNADFIGKYFRKGNAIGIDGSIQSRQYQDKDGNNRTAVEVVVERASFVESKSAANRSTGGASDFDNYGASPAFQNNSNNSNYSSGSVDDFEELESDADLPF